MPRAWSNPAPQSQASTRTSRPCCTHQRSCSRSGTRGTPVQQAGTGPAGRSGSAVLRSWREHRWRTECMQAWRTFHCTQLDQLSLRARHQHVVDAHIQRARGIAAHGEATRHHALLREQHAAALVRAAPRLCARGQAARAGTEAVAPHGSICRLQRCVAAQPVAVARDGEAALLRPRQRQRAARAHRQVVDGAGHCAAVGARRAEAACVARQLCAARGGDEIAAGAGAPGQALSCSILRHIPRRVLEERQREVGQPWASAAAERMTRQRGVQDSAR